MNNEIIKLPNGDFEVCPLSVSTEMIEEFLKAHPEMKGTSVQGALNSLAFEVWKYRNTHEIKLEVK